MLQGCTLCVLFETQGFGGPRLPTRANPGIGRRNWRSSALGFVYFFGFAWSVFFLTSVSFWANNLISPHKAGLAVAYNKIYRRSQYIISPAEVNCEGRHMDIWNTCKSWVSS